MKWLQQNLFLLLTPEYIPNRDKIAEQLTLIKDRKVHELGFFEHELTMIKR